MTNGYVPKAEQYWAKQRKENRKNMIRINEEARKAGMTYGKYVALKKMKGEAV